MLRTILCVILFSCFSIMLPAQINTKKFGKGVQLLGEDSTFYVKMNVRFQNLMQHNWSLDNDDLGSLQDHSSNFLVRRSRLKFGGWALNPKLK